MYRGDEPELDMNRLIVKPLYFGLVTNILVPMGLLLSCYYIHSRNGLDNSVGDFANSLFFLLAILSAGHAVFALWWRARQFRQPLVCAKESFEDDLGAALLKISRPIFIIIAIIALYGVAYYFLTGRFRETVFLVFFSFLVFQLVRPRHGQLKRLIEKQQKLPRKKM